MNTIVLKSLASFFLLVSFIFSFISFKMHKNLFDRTMSSKERRHIEEVSRSENRWSLIDHGTYFGVFDTGVCKFGKMIWWLLFVWNITLVSLMFSFNDKTKLLRLLQSNIVANVFLILGGLSMNYPLIFRSVPYFISQTCGMLILYFGIIKKL